MKKPQNVDSLHLLYSCLVFTKELKWGKLCFPYPLGIFALSKLSTLFPTKMQPNSAKKNSPGQMLCAPPLSPHPIKGLYDALVFDGHTVLISKSHVNEYKLNV